MQERYLIPLKIVLVYVAWKVFHHFTTIEGTALYYEWQKLSVFMGTAYAKVTAALLSAGMRTGAEGININLLDYNKQIWVQEHCLAIPAMVVFAGTVLLFKGSWKDKLWFLPLGIAGIVCINIARLMFVSLAFVHLSAYFFNLHHSFIYAAITYGFIFLMLMWWMRHNTTAAASQA